MCWNWEDRDAAIVHMAYCKQIWDSEGHDGSLAQLKYLVGSSMGAKKYTRSKNSWFLEFIR
jgi:hypothetical protein